MAKISREARERQLEAARVEREISDYIDFRYVIGGVGLVATLCGLYYLYKREIREENSRTDKLKHHEKRKRRKKKQQS